jgi:hypothetical protein
MKFILELPLHRSRAEVWRAFNNPENMKKWQPTLVNIRTISGVQGQPGAVSRLTYAEGKGEFTLSEKVTYRAECEFALTGSMKTTSPKTARSTFSLR